MAKAHGLTWLLLAAAAPMIAMGVLYSRVVYSLWIKRDGRANGSQKVRIKRIFKFYCDKTDKTPLDALCEFMVNQSYTVSVVVGGIKAALQYITPDNQSLFMVI